MNKILFPLVLVNLDNDIWYLPRKMVSKYLTGIFVFLLSIVLLP
jgi:hypothetical protein